MTHLKFRAYHKTEKKIYSVSVLDFDNQDVMLSDNEETFYDVIPMSEVEIMQSTGLTDKNGKEIFEGDVVEYLDASGLANEDVGINHGIVELDLREGIHFTNRSSVEMEDVDFDSDVEIIGNIYENPELINS